MGVTGPAIHVSPPFPRPEDHRSPLQDPPCTRVLLAAG